MVVLLSELQASNPDTRETGLGKVTTVKARVQLALKKVSGHIPVKRHQEMANEAPDKLRKRSAIVTNQKAL